jgi:hypothetical protein
VVFGDVLPRPLYFRVVLVELFLPGLLAGTDWRWCRVSRSSGQVLHAAQRGQAPHIAAKGELLRTQEAACWGCCEGERGGAAQLVYCWPCVPFPAGLC